MDNKAYDTEETSFSGGDDVTQPATDVKMENGVVDGPEVVTTADNNNKDDKVSVEMSPPGVAEKPYADMGKEDLLRFSETVFWQRFRLVSIILFWLAWLALLGAVIGLTIVAPRCDPQPTPLWWQDSVIYQIYVRSFYDGNSDDGVGDIRGVTAKMSYLVDLNVSAILLSSVFESHHVTGQSDYGYEITNHTAIQSEYGDLADLKELIEAAHNESIRVLLDFIPNHTGLDHEWFAASLSSGAYSNPYWNYYVWADCAGGTTMPNNWLSVYSESAWEFNVTRNQCYLHQFLKSQPELNLRSTAVQQELEKILRYWLELGVDGFRVVNTANLFESADFADEISTCSSTTDYDCYDHSQTTLLQESYDIVARWREIIDEYSTATPNYPRVLLTDANVTTSVSQAVKYYGNSYGLTGAHLAINYGMTYLNATTDGSYLAGIARNWTDSMPTGATADWLTGDQDGSRLLSYAGGWSMVNAFQTVRLTLPGAAFIYYGEEIGLENGCTTANPCITRHDPAGHIDIKYSRDGFRTPMQWNNDSATSAGFTNSSSGSWLPVYNETSVNVNSQINDTTSTLNLVIELIKLHRSEGSLRYGAIHYAYNDTRIFSFVREHEGNDWIVVAVNIGSDSTPDNIDLTRDNYGISIPSSAEVILVTDSTMELKSGNSVKLNGFKLDPGQGFVAKWPYKRPM